MKQRQQKRAEIRKKQEERRNIKGIWKMETFKAKGAFRNKISTCSMGNQPLFLGGGGE
jgi:hypothetical protein